MKTFNFFALKIIAFGSGIECVKARISILKAPIVLLQLYFKRLISMFLRPIDQNFLFKTDAVNEVV